MWDVDGAKLGTSLKGSEQCVPLSIAFNPDGQTIAAGCATHAAMIMMWNVRKGSELARPL
ncbi:hypothetical protein [Nonomuraea insulae]|uniref:Uncharacterized protein n=1 Tax=Nonomuraea insulae TaxID=1616787 RepID=A0ABW1CIN9_9ACTN